MKITLTAVAALAASLALGGAGFAQSDNQTSSGGMSSGSMSPGSMSSGAPSSTAPPSGGMMSHDSMSSRTSAMPMGRHHHHHRMGMRHKRRHRHHGTAMSTGAMPHHPMSPNAASPNAMSR